MAETNHALAPSTTVAPPKPQVKAMGTQPFLSQPIGTGSASAMDAASSRQDRRSAVIQAREKVLGLSPQVQAKGAIEATGSDRVHAVAEQGIQGGASALPHLDTIQSSFGQHDISGVSAHTGSTAKSAAQDMGAMAYTRGNDVVLDNQDLFTVAHEAAHVVQQRSGVQLRDGVGQSGDAFENHADAVAAKVVKGESAESLLSEQSSGQSSSSAVQQKGDPKSEAWAERTRSLVGSWVRVRPSKAPLLDPKNKGKSGAWGETGDSVKGGQKVFVAGMVESDGAINVNIPIFTKNKYGGHSVTYKHGWMHHYQTALSTAPPELVGPNTGVKIPGGNSKKVDNDKDKKNQQKRDAGVHQLKGVNGFGDSLTKAAGAVLDAMVPDKGSKSKMQLNVNVPVPAAPGTSISLRMVIEAERDEDNNVKMKSEMGAGVLTKADLWLVEVFAQVMLFGFVETRGDSGYEAFRLLDLVMYNAIDAVSTKAAKLLYGNNALADIKRDVVNGAGDNDDYAMGGFGVEATVGARAGSGSAEREMKGTARHQGGSKFMANAPDKAIDISSDKYTVSTSVAGWAGQISYEDKMEAGKSSGEVEVSASKMVPFPTFRDMCNENGAMKVIGGAWLTGVVGNVGTLLQKRSGLYQKNGAGQGVGSALKTVSAFSFSSGVLRSAATQKLKDKFGDFFEGTVGMKATLKINWDAKGAKFEIWFDRQSKTEFGAEMDRVYVLLENISGIYYSGAIGL